MGVKLNRAAQNKGFNEKQNNFYGKSEIKMTQDLMKYKTWDKDDIITRAKELSKKNGRDVETKLNQGEKGGGRVLNCNFQLKCKSPSFRSHSIQNGVRWCL